ncbi:MAG: acyltransferase [Apibacter sp.]|nr:acyltransferase [Apibacter sp.]
MRKNNFDFLRLLLSILIIITHSYDLKNNNTTDFLSDFSGFSVAYLTVKSFFVMSGFLVCNSLLRSYSLLAFYWKRFLRIYPGLFAALCFTILLLPFAYDKSFSDYITNKDVYTYIPNNLSLFNLQYTVSGIFENNPFPKVINGSLWTLRYEFFFYIFISFLFFIKKYHLFLKIFLITVLLSDMVLYFYFTAHNPSSIQIHFTDLSISFISGVLFSVFNFHRLNYNYIKIIFFVSLLLFFLFARIFDEHYFLFCQYFIFPFIVICFGLLSIYPLNKINIIGDLSYGIYISAFVIQQFIINFSPEIHPLNLAIFTFILSSIYAYFSWHFIEIKALNLKK